MDAILLVDSGTGSRRVRLADYLDADGEEGAATDAYASIKALRHARVDGDTLRQRFTYRGDTLWWFAELYLHKEQAILKLLRAIRAAEALIERERPLAIDFDHADSAVTTAVSGAAGLRRIRCAPVPVPAETLRLSAMDVRSTALAAAAMASPGRPADRQEPAPSKVAAFVHSAFWKSGGGEDGSAES